MRRLLPKAILLLAINYCLPAGSAAQVGTGFFNSAVFGTYNDTTAGSLSGNNFTISYTGSYAIERVASYNPGYMPANTAFPAVNGDVLELMATAPNATTLYTFASPLQQYSTLFIQDLDLNESVQIEFYDASNTLINTSNILYRSISTSGLATVTFSPTSINVSETAGFNYLEPLIALVINSSNVQSVKITQLSPQTTGTYEFYWGMISVDHGDAPASYGDAGHVPTTLLNLGTQSPDAELSAAYSAAADGDNAAISATVINDEDGVSSFPALSVSSTSYSVTVNLVNSTGADATLTGWIDFNGDGVFDASESSTPVTVPDGSTSATVTWPALSGLVLGNTFARFRIATIASEITDATGFASSGEAEDYQLSITAALPLKLVNFSAERSKSDILVSWKTANEINTDHFEVEYSKDGIEYATGGKVKAGNKADNNYTLTLFSYTAPLYYIRLKTTDADGKISYSGPLTVRMAGDNSLSLSVTPNPVIGNAILHITSASATVAVIRITDMLGHTSYQESRSLIKGENSIYIEKQANLSKGNYIITVTLNGALLTRKIIVH